MVPMLFLQSIQYLKADFLYFLVEKSENVALSSANHCLLAYHGVWLTAQLYPSHKE